MDMQKIQEQIEGISQKVNVPAELASLCGLYLSALDNLKGDVTDSSFLRTLNETCDKLKENTEERLRIATIIDVLLAASFYYKRAHLWSSKRKEFQTSFALLLWEGYNLLMDWHDEYSEEYYERINYSERLFNEFALEASRTDFNRFNLWRNMVKQYRIILSHGLKRLDSRLKNIFAKYAKEIFIFSSWILGNFYLLAWSITTLSGGLVLLALSHLFYKFYVEKPYFSLLVGEGIKRHKIESGELYIAREAFWDWGLFALGTPLRVFLFGLLTLLFIELIQGFFGWKILFRQKIVSQPIKR